MAGLAIEPPYAPVVVEPQADDVPRVDDRRQQPHTPNSPAPAASLRSPPAAATNRHRLDRGGNRQINTAIHRVAITRARRHPETKAYIARKRQEGKTHREAIRCLKRHLTRRIWHLLQPPQQPLTPSPFLT
jgi:hypothetical protein